MPIFGRFKITRRRLAAIALIGGVFVSLPSYVSAYTVSGPSEAPTLLLGDRVIVNLAAYDLKLPYSTIRLCATGAPRRGDLVAFLVPNRNTLGLKRVVGLPGDVVEMRENRLIVNGRSAEDLPLPGPISTGCRRSTSWAPSWRRSEGSATGRTGSPTPPISLRSARPRPSRCRTTATSSWATTATTATTRGRSARSAGRSSPARSSAS